MVESNKHGNNTSGLVISSGWRVRVDFPTETSHFSRRSLRSLTFSSLRQSLVFKHSTRKRDAGFEARNVMKSHKDHSRDSRIPIARTATRFTCVGSSATRCEFGSIARLKPARIHSRTPPRIQHLSMSPPMYPILFLPVYQPPRILLYHYTKITTKTTNNDNVPNTTIDFDFDDTPDSDSDSNDEYDSNDDSDNEEESIITGSHHSTRARPVPGY